MTKRKFPPKKWLYEFVHNNPSDAQRLGVELKMDQGEMRLEYCPVCDENTAQVIVMDPIFGKALECTECNTVWETDPESIAEDDEE